MFCLEAKYNGIIVKIGFGDYEDKPIHFDLIVPKWDYRLNDSSYYIKVFKIVY